MKWIGRTAAAAAIMGVAVFGGWACSDDSGGELTLEAYFEKLDEQADELAARGDDMDAVFEASEEPTMEEVEAALDEFSGHVDDFVSEMNGIDPPAEVEEAHGALVSAAGAAGDAFSDVASGAGAAESVEAAFSGEAGDAAFTAVEEFVGACLELEGIADANNIEVSLDCEDQEA